MLRWLIPLLLLVTPAAAQQSPQNCAPYEEWQRRFTANSMTAKEFAIVESGLAMQMWSNADGQWGMIFFNPEGTTCLIARGEGWRVLPEHKESRDS